MPARARGYIRRQTLRRCAGLSLPPAALLIPKRGSFCRRRCTAFRASSMRRHRHTTPLRHLIERKAARQMNPWPRGRAFSRHSHASDRRVGRGARRSQSRVIRMESIALQRTARQRLIIETDSYLIINPEQRARTNYELHFRHERRDPP